MTSRKGRLRRESLMRPIGKVLLALCPSGRKACENAHCALRAFCACAQKAVAAGNRTEARVWAAIAICGALGLLIALLRAIWR